MKTKWMAVLAILTLMTCGGAVLTYAQGPGGPGGWGHGPGPMGHMFHELNLTDAQKQQVKTIMEANKAAMHSLMLQMTRCSPMEHSAVSTQNVLSPLPLLAPQFCGCIE